MNRPTSRRRAACSALVAGALAVLAVACTAGPAANRAEQLGMDTRQPSRGPMSQPPGSGPRPGPDPVPRPEPAPAEGSVTVTREIALPRLRGTACCLAGLPGGDLMVGVRETGRLYRVAVDAGIAAEVGAISGVAAGEGDPRYRLLDVAVPSEATGEEVDLFAYYARSGGAEVGRYSYDPAAPEWQDPVSWSPWTIADDLPTPAAAVGTLAFGPDGMVFAGRGGDVLRMQTDGYVPDDNPASGSLVYSSGHGDVAGIAWDAAGRAWSADAATGAVRAVVPGALAGTAPVLAEVDQARGLAYCAGSLWIGTSAADGLWRLPLDGAELVADPARLPVDVDGAPVGVVDVLAAANGGLWLLTGDGRILLTSVS
jgi:aldose sugar dehydrogenase